MNVHHTAVQAVLLAIRDTTGYGRDTHEKVAMPHVDGVQGRQYGEGVVRPTRQPRRRVGVVGHGRSSHPHLASFAAHCSELCEPECDAPHQSLMVVAEYLCALVSRLSRLSTALALVKRLPAASIKPTARPSSTAEYCCCLEKGDELLSVMVHYTRQIAYPPCVILAGPLDLSALRRQHKQVLDARRCDAITLLATAHPTPPLHRQYTRARDLCIFQIVGICVSSTARFPIGNVLWAWPCPGLRSSLFLACSFCGSITLFFLWFREGKVQALLAAATTRP